MTALEAGRVQSIMVTLYKYLHGMAPSCLRSYIQKRRVSNYNLRGYNTWKYRMLGLAPMVYHFLDIMPLMPGMTLISESLIRLQLSNEIS